MISAISPHPHVYKRPRESLETRHVFVPRSRVTLAASASDERRRPEGREPRLELAGSPAQLGHRDGGVGVPRADVSQSDDDFGSTLVRLVRLERANLRARARARR